MGLFSSRKAPRYGKLKVKKVSLDLTPYEAVELAGYLDGTDMHLSIGDRLTLARRLRQLARRQDEHSNWHKRNPSFF